MDFSVYLTNYYLFKTNDTNDTLGTRGDSRVCDQVSYVSSDYNCHWLSSYKGGPQETFGT